MNVLVSKTGVSECSQLCCFLVCRALEIIGPNTGRMYTAKHNYSSEVLCFLRALIKGTEVVDTSIKL